MSEIRVQCIDQAISFLNTPVISSGNVNYDRIVFDFCSRWDGYVKTAIFYRNKDEVYYQLLENDSCLIPNEVLGEKGIVYIGVFGTQGDKTITSQVLTYRIQEGAVTEDLKPSDPTPDIYAQIMGRFADFANELTDQQAKLDEFEARFNGSAGDAEKLGGQLPEYYATAQSVTNLETNLENGTKKVGKATEADSAGDSSKLGGKGASEYVLLANAILNGLFSEQCKNVSVGSNITAQELFAKTTVTFFTNWYDSTNFPMAYGNGVVIPCLDPTDKEIMYMVGQNLYIGSLKYNGSTWVVTWSDKLATTADLANCLNKTIGGTVSNGTEIPLGVNNPNGWNSLFRFSNTAGGGLIGFQGSTPIVANADFSVINALIHNGNVDSYTENIQSTSLNYPKKAGWYRVAEIGASGGASHDCDITIRTGYSNCYPEYAKVRVRSTHTNKEILCLDRKSNYGDFGLFTKARLTHDSTKVYFEMYYNCDTENPVRVTVSDSISPWGNASWKALPPTLTSETVDGVTVDVTYDLSKNVIPVTSGNIGNYALPLSGGTVQELALGHIGMIGDSGFKIVQDGNILSYLTFSGRNKRFEWWDPTDGYHCSQILDTKNSARVLVQSTPLTAEGAVRVW